jgi:hypothetical protein
MPAILGQLLDARSRALVGRDRERAALVALGGFAAVRQVAENSIDPVLEAGP